LQPPYIGLMQTHTLFVSPFQVGAMAHGKIDCNYIDEFVSGKSSSFIHTFVKGKQKKSF